MKGCANAAISILQKAVDASQESDAYYMNGRLTSAAKLQLLADKYTSATQQTGIAANGDGSSSNCRPWNYGDYLNRLRSFRDTTKWFAKPPCISPLECASWGWRCDSSVSDCLVCNCCGGKLMHNTTEDTSGALLASQLGSGHQQECGWKSSTPPNTTSSIDTTNTAADRVDSCISNSERIKDSSNSMTTTTTTTAAAGVTCCCDPSFKDIPGLSSAPGTCELLLQRALSLLAMASIHHNDKDTNMAETEAASAMHKRVIQLRERSGSVLYLPLDVTSTASDKVRAHLISAKKKLSNGFGIGIGGYFGAASRVGGEKGEGVGTAAEVAAALTLIASSLSGTVGGVSKEGGGGEGSADDKLSAGRSAEQQLLSAVLLLAISGWELAAAETGTTMNVISSAGTFEHCASVNNNTKDSTNGAAGAAVSTAAVSCASISCSLCGRSVSLKPFLAASPQQQQQQASRTALDLDCVSQHRYYCPFVNPPAQWPSWCVQQQQQLFLNAKSESTSSTTSSYEREPEGWQLVLAAAVQVLGTTTAPTRSPPLQSLLPRPPPLVQGGVAQSTTAKEAEDSARPAVEEKCTKDRTEFSNSPSEGANVCEGGVAGKRSANRVALESQGDRENTSSFSLDPSLAYKRIRNVLDLVVSK